MLLSYSLKACSVATTLVLTTMAGRAQAVPPQAPPAQAAPPQSTPELIEAGDQYDLKLEPAKALECYLPAAKLDPKNGCLFARIARQYRHLMCDAPTREEKLRLAGIALSYGQRAAALAPNDSEAQLSPAITYGKMLPFQGSKEQVQAAPRIKAAADMALKLDPQNDLAWHVLGRWHQVLAGVGGIKRTLGGLIYGKLPVTTNQEAVRCFDKAIELNPHRLRHFIELGRTYAQMGQSADARRFIAMGLAMPSTEKDDPELKAKGRETLAKLQ